MYFMPLYIHVHVATGREGGVRYLIMSPPPWEPPSDMHPWIIASSLSLCSMQDVYSVIPSGMDI